MISRSFRLSLVALVSLACLASCTMPCAGEAGVVTFTLLQVNDVYESKGLDGGRSGGLARVAALRQSLVKENPNTFTILAGDTFSPSPVGNMVIDEAPLAGRQMVALWNVLGLDYATLGNHEFDVKRPQFFQRIRESDFTWIASNVRDRVGLPFAGVRDDAVLDVVDTAGNHVRVGLFGLTIDSNHANYVRYLDPVATARRKVGDLKPRSDVVVAITHLAIDKDKEIANNVNGIHLLIGGHEHTRNYVASTSIDGRPTPPIAKADANARSAWVHRITFDADARTVSIASELIDLRDDAPAFVALLKDDDVKQAYADMSKAVDRWWVDYSIAFLGVNGTGPGDVVTLIDAKLDGRDDAVRRGSTNLSRLIAQGMIQALAEKVGPKDPRPRLAIYNSGSIRLDDVIPKGPVTVYDVHRTLPFPAAMLRGVQMTGALVKELVGRNANPAHLDNGNFLQAFDADGVSLLTPAGIGTIKDATDYLVVIADFLIDGKENDFGDLKGDVKPGLKKLPELATVKPIRDALLSALKTLKIAPYDEPANLPHSATVPTKPPTAVLPLGPTATTSR